MNVCGEPTYSVFEWARWFKEGRRSVYDNEQPGAPVRMQHLQMKAMLVCFFDVHGIVQHEFVPPYQTVTAKFYLEVLGCLRAQITQAHIMTMHQHIHLSQYANICRKKYSDIATSTLQPRPCPCDFFLFTELELVLKETRFDDLEEIKTNTTCVLKVLTSSDFKSCLKVWERRWNKCVTLGGGEGYYCEGIEV